MVEKCFVCGKTTVILYPELWVYKISEFGRFQYECSYTCWQIAKKGEKYKVGKTIVSPEQKMQAVETAIAGGNPFKVLEDAGAAASGVMWREIKIALKEKDPDKYWQLPERFLFLADRGKQKPVETPEKPAMPEKPRIETPETPERIVDLPADKMMQIPELPEAPKPAPAKKPILTDGYTTTAVAHEMFGEFYHDRKHGLIDWRTPSGDEVTLTPVMWSRLAHEIPMMLMNLGVKP